MPFLVLFWSLQKTLQDAYVSCLGLFISEWLSFSLKKLVNHCAQHWFATCGCEKLGNCFGKLRSTRWQLRKRVVFDNGCCWAGVLGRDACQHS
jgi:hypothetical protein